MNHNNFLGAFMSSTVAYTSIPITADYIKVEDLGKEAPHEPPTPSAKAEQPSVELTSKDVCKIDVGDQEPSQAAKQPGRELTLKDFCPVNEYEVVTDHPEQKSMEVRDSKTGKCYIFSKDAVRKMKFNDDGSFEIGGKTYSAKEWEIVDGAPKWVRDKTTGKLYLNESKNLTRFKCGLLVVFSPPMHAIACVTNFCYRGLKIIAGYHFTDACNDGCPTDLRSRFKELGRDILRVGVSATGLPIVVHELSALYGLVNPRDGRKLYSSFERAIYGEEMCMPTAPCFWPHATHHFFGGDINQQNTM